MLIIGAGGFAKQLVSAIDMDVFKSILFYDNVARNEQTKFLGRFDIISRPDEAVRYLKDVDSRFALGIGGPGLRSRLSKEMSSMGGVLTKCISKLAVISEYGVALGAGATILPYVLIEPDVHIEEGVLLNVGSRVFHDASVGAYSEIGPGAMLLGRVSVGESCFIGAGAIVLPEVSIGSNCVIGAGAVVTKDIPSGNKVVGVPGKIK
jgi:sugar O-acyltransferase (sialic acid O-acetyltransferase NeuD family)